MIDDEEFSFAEEGLETVIDASPWIILIADDEEDVHKTSEFVFKHTLFHGKPVKLLHTYSGKDTILMVQSRDDIDLLILDGVMETDDAGLYVAKYIRRVMGRKIPTIIMRSGFAGWDQETGLEVQTNLEKFPCIDAFILKTDSAHRKLEILVDTWLGHEIP